MELLPFEVILSDDQLRSYRIACGKVMKMLRAHFKTSRDPMRLEQDDLQQFGMAPPSVPYTYTGTSEAINNEAVIKKFRWLGYHVEEIGNTNTGPVVVFSLPTNWHLVSHN